MSRLLELLTKEPLTLIVSLPENDPQLAAAALRGGAQALKVHLYIEHQAARTRFGSFAEEKSHLQEIMKIASVPVGLVPGDEHRYPDEKEFQEIRQFGFDFLDMRLSAILPWMYQSNGIGKVAAIEPGYSVESLIDLQGRGIDAIEAAVVPPPEYGKNVTVGDLQNYVTISVTSGIPVIVPTQRRITVRDVPFILDTGAKAVMIGVIVTGRTPESIEETTRAFRNTIDTLEG